MTEYLDNYHLNVLTPLKNLREINKSQGNKLFIEITKNKAIYQDFIDKLEKVIINKINLD